MKKKWLFIPVLAGMLMLALVGGTAFSQSENGDESSPLSSFASRVASILGLDEATVQDAMDQARQEMREEALQAKLNFQVEQGLITQEQADEYYEWYQARPEDLPRAWFGGRGFGKSGRHGWHGGAFKNHVVPTPTAESSSETTESA